jgi:tRNA uridine 5-carboxymethylaminomethyl modification enzyme
MFTSRAEYRLLLREDNADLRLRDKGRSLGLVNDKDYQAFVKKKGSIKAELERLGKIILYPTPGENDRMKAMGSAPIKNPTALTELLRLPKSPSGIWQSLIRSAPARKCEAGGNSG